MVKMSLLFYIREYLEKEHFIMMASVFENLIHQHVLSTVCLSNVFIINSADEQLINSAAWITFLQSVI